MSYYYKTWKYFKHFLYFIPVRSSHFIPISELLSLTIIICNVITSNESLRGSLELCTTTAGATKQCLGHRFSAALDHSGRRSR